MHAKSRRPSAGTLIGTVALVFAITGAAVALPGKNTVDSGDIKNKQVKKADIGKPTVRTLDLINQWGPEPTDGNPIRVVKDVTGTVRLEGIIQRTGGGSTEPFVMPAGFRPPNPVFLPVDANNTTHARLVIQPDGEVDIFDGGSGESDAFTSLEGPTYRAR